jgi:hypothetical protein
MHDEVEQCGFAIRDAVPSEFEVQELSSESYEMLKRGRNKRS